MPLETWAWRLQASESMGAYLKRSIAETCCLRWSWQLYIERAFNCMVPWASLHWVCSQRALQTQSSCR